MATILPRAVRTLAQELTRLPGIGPKTGQRLALHLLRQPYPVVAQLAEAMKNLQANVRTCRTCFNLAEAQQCVICQDPQRLSTALCVVEDPLDVEAIEKTGTYRGLYHVLGGVLSPLDGVGLEQLTMNELFQRLDQSPIEELIIALDQNMESEATTHYITHQTKSKPLKITRLARGLPTGSDIEFADATTLTAAFHGRRTL